LANGFDDAGVPVAGAGGCGAGSVGIIPAQAALISEWLDGAAQPLARVLDQLSGPEQEAFVKAMNLLETELHGQDERHG
jgi:hypothetical protein